MDKEIMKSFQRISLNKVKNELKNEKIESNCIWYMFPKLKNIEPHYLSNLCALDSINEVKEYLEDDELRNNLFELCEILLNTKCSSAIEIFKYPNYISFHESITLFYLTNPNISYFKEILNKFFNGELEEKTKILILCKNNN